LIMVSKHLLTLPEFFLVTMRTARASAAVTIYLKG